MIYVITHKVFDSTVINEDNYKDYKILHVGTNTNCNSSYLRDDVGDNISGKNSSYCELTGMYWVWKNRSIETDPIVGISHYRRYFCTKGQLNKYIHKNVLPRPLTKEQYERLLCKADIIVPKPKTSVRHNVYQLYDLFHNSRDLDVVRSIINYTTPEYVDSFEKEMKSHRVLYANMFICRKQLYDNYCEWLFTVLNELERVIQPQNSKIITKEDKYQGRIFGFIAERLLQVWIRKNKLKVVYMPVFNTETKERSLLYDLIESRLKPLVGEILLHRDPKEQIRKRIDNM